MLIPRIAEIWKRKGIKMKQHLSEPRPGAESVMERRAHADRCKSLPDALPDDVDLMIEAKDKVCPFSLMLKVANSPGASGV